MTTEAIRTNPLPFYKRWGVVEWSCLAIILGCLGGTLHWSCGVARDYYTSAALQQFTNDSVQKQVVDLQSKVDWIAKQVWYLRNPQSQPPDPPPMSFRTDDAENRTK